LLERAIQSPRDPFSPTLTEQTEAGGCANFERTMQTDGGRRALR
jgi:hypothetical protein